MPGGGNLSFAANFGMVEEVRTLLYARANIEEEDAVTDGAGTSVAAGFVGVVSCLWKLLESLSYRTGNAAASTANWSHFKLGHFVFS